MIEICAMVEQEKEEIESLETRPSFCSWLADQTGRFISHQKWWATPSFSSSSLEVRYHLAITYEDLVCLIGRSTKGLERMRGALIQSFNLSALQPPMTSRDEQVER